MIFIGKKYSCGKSIVGEDFHHLTKISSLFPEESFLVKLNAKH